MFIQNSAATLQFELSLNQFITVGEVLAKAIKCLEAAASNPADVYLSWLAVTTHMRAALTTSGLPDSFCADIQGIINQQWHQFFIDGLTNVHLSVFYLNPGMSCLGRCLHVTTEIWKQHTYIQQSSNVLMPSRFPSHSQGRKLQKFHLVFEAQKCSKKLASTY
jgi:hypothetical protein